MSIQKDIAELVKAGIITPGTGDKIRDYYENKGGQFQHRLLIVFGILGAILVGLGIILIVAHNWDEFSRTTKTIFAFLPMLIGQIIAGYSLYNKPESIAWKESSAAFLFFTVGACISLVSQIYNIPGNLSAFLLTWMLLCLPLIYVMKSSITSLLYLAGITYYACETGYWGRPVTEFYTYWLLLLAALPHYYFLYRKKPQSNFMIFHNWLIPLSIVIALGTLADKQGELMFIAYISLFGLFYLIGNRAFFKNQRVLSNGYLAIGALGTIVLLLSLSFDWFWQDLRKQTFQFNEVISSAEFLASVLVSLFASGLLYLQLKQKKLGKLNPFEAVYILFILIFSIGLFSQLSVVLINLLVFAIGVLTIISGTKRDHLGILNFGLLVIVALVTCRFFDADLSFVVRGILFVSVGAGFFATNYWMIKRRKNDE